MKSKRSVAGSAARETPPRLHLASHPMDDGTPPGEPLARSVLTRPDDYRLGVRRSGLVHVRAATAAAVLVALLTTLPLLWMAGAWLVGLLAGRWAGLRSARALEDRFHGRDAVILYLEDTATFKALRLLRPFAFVLVAVAASRSAGLQAILAFLLCAVAAGWLAHEAVLAQRADRLASRLGQLPIRWLYARSAVGPEAMIGRIGIVTRPCRPSGLVRLGGELWRAQSSDGAPIDMGATVRVRWLDGLVLLVERDEGEPQPAESQTGGGPVSVD